MESNVSLVGSGWGKTVLRASDGLNANVIRATSEVGCYVADLEVDGNFAGQSAGGGTTYLIGFEGTNESIVEHCYVHDGYSHGIGDYGDDDGNAVTVGNKFINNLVVDIDWNAICVGRADYPSVNTVISGNTVVNFGDLGIAVVSGRYCLVSNNVVVLNSSLALDGSEGGLRAICTEGNLGYYNLIADNLVDFSDCAGDANESWCIALTAGYADTLADNVVKANSIVHVGIYVYVPDCKVSGGYVSGLTDEFGFGIQLTGTGDRSVVSGVSFVNSTVGVGVYTGNANSAVFGNSFSSCTNNFYNETVFRCKMNFDVDAGDWEALEW